MCPNSRQEKAFINIAGKISTAIPEIKCNIDSDTLVIDVNEAEGREDYTLNIDTSIKANIDIEGCNGDIDVGSFYGKYIKVNSKEGQIKLAKCQCESVHLSSDNGNIVCKDVVQAGDIKLKIRNFGKITTDRLQGLTLTAYVSNGMINVGSSYCNNSKFGADIGEFTLNNLHKHTEIDIKQEGLLNIVGLDGDAFINMKKGLANIQFTRINKDSTIHFNDESSLILRLSDECQKENLVEILAKDLFVSDDLKMVCKKESKERCELLPRNGKGENKLHVKCQESHVIVNSYSWSELFEASFRSRG
ncbi:hypothetical protein Trydic_g15667 [Trypoxylus dichotomus]